MVTSSLTPRMRSQLACCTQTGREFASHISLGVRKYHNRLINSVNFLFFVGIQSALDMYYTFFCIYCSLNCNNLSGTFDKSVQSAVLSWANIERNMRSMWMQFMRSCSMDEMQILQEYFDFWFNLFNWNLLGIGIKFLTSVHCVPWISSKHPLGCTKQHRSHHHRLLCDFFTLRNEWE